MRTYSTTTDPDADSRAKQKKESQAEFDARTMAYGHPGEPANRAERRALDKARKRLGL